MKPALSVIFLSVSCIAISPASGQSSQVDETDGGACVYDRAALLSLDERAFDQDMNGGWRAVARHEQCIDVAADLIRDYRQTRNIDSLMLYWHEGQLRATIGETDQAIRLFESARQPEDDPIGWNLYVDATIAFLKKDRASLQEARAALAQLPRPGDFAPRDEAGNPLDIPWPPNLHVVDMLIECFDREYEEAYGGCEQ